MKRLFTILITILISASAHAEWDEFYNSNYFEPALVCVAAGTAGYFLAPTNNQVAYAAGGCIIGGIITYAVNRHYEAKYTKAYNQRIDRLTESLKMFQELQANKAANGDEGPYSLRIREIVPAQVLSNGAVRAPTISEKLIVPGADLRVGD
jgi:hypothetical protein